VYTICCRGKLVAASFCYSPNFSGHGKNENCQLPMNDLKPATENRFFLQKIFRLELEYVLLMYILHERIAIYENFNILAYGGS